MKKICILLFCFFTVQMAAAQDVRVGLRTGLNFANQHIENETLDFFNTNFDSKNRLAWQAGLLLEVPLATAVTVQPALLLSSKGYDYQGTNFFGNLEIEARPLYLHIPAPVLAYATGQDFRVFGGLGPYLGFGVGGEIESKGDVVQIGFVEEGNISWGTAEDESYRPFDWGAIFTAGVEYNQFQLAVAYELGLANIHPQADEDNSTRNRVLSLTTSYFILRK